MLNDYFPTCGVLCSEGWKVYDEIPTIRFFRSQPPSDEIFETIPRGLLNVDFVDFLGVVEV